MTEIEIVKITNNRSNRVTTQKTKSILFHLKKFHNLNENQKLIQLLETLEAISFA